MQERDRPCALVILAAGQGSRMNSDTPKVLHQIGGAPLVVHAINAGASLEPSRVIVITGHGADAVEASVAAHEPGAICVRQAKQLGTGHAVLQAAPALDAFDGDVIVLYGDTPFITDTTLQTMRDARAGHDIVMLGFEAENPGRYGRMVMTGTRLDRIVEAKDASAEDLALTLCNSGLLCADATTLMALLAEVGNDNASGEYYLTDIPAIAATKGLTSTAVSCAEAETLGINTRAELANAEQLFQNARRGEMQTGGVTMVAPETVFFAFDTWIGRDVLIEPNVIFGPEVTVENDCTIRAFSHLEGCHLGARVTVGPYARLRPGAELGNDAKIGNFVEVKAAEIGEGAKVNHLSYIGDATIGARSNIGAGTITCNYDGVFKHKTEIGSDASIGSNTMLVAPVNIGDGAMTGSGSVITKDVPAGDLAIGRAKQSNKSGFGTRLMAKLRARKEQQKKGH